MTTTKVINLRRNALRKGGRAVIKGVGAIGAFNISWLQLLLRRKIPGVLEHLRVKFLLPELLIDEPQPAVVFRRISAVFDIVLEYLE